MTAARSFVLLLAGIGAGLTGSIAGLASVVSYPALLAAGLSPVTANVTNTVSLVFSTLGSTIGSRPELAGQRDRIRVLALAGMLGGACGGALLLLTPAETFERAVPFLIGAAALAILVRRRIVDAAYPHPAHHTRALVLGVGAVCVYGGYFGAGAGVMLLALLLLVTGEPLPRCNAVKNVVLGVANATAAVAFTLFGPVRWSVVVPLGAGLFVGGRLGPIAVRRLPAAPLRIAIAAAGFAVAVSLAIDTF